MNLIKKMPNQTLDLVATLLLESDHVTFLTGAGISVPSGVPDFRSKNGLWSKYDPEEFATAEAFKKNPDKVWKMFWDALKIRDKVKPNPAHYAIAEIEKLRQAINRKTVIITQNVDGLHQRAGSTYVLELHGSASRARCGACRSSYDIDLLRRQTPKNKAPLCDLCGTVLKLDVVLFGDYIDPMVLDRCKKELKETDMVLAVGTSLDVYPASDFFITSRGKRVFINIEQPEKDIEADYVIDGDVIDVLPNLLRQMKQAEKSTNY